LKKDKVKAAASLTAVEERDVSTDSAFMIEQVGAVHHNKKGQYFAKVEFIGDHKPDSLLGLMRALIKVNRQKSGSKLTNAIA